MKSQYSIGFAPRVQKTLNLIAQGYSNEEIAEEMQIKMKTVEGYVNQIVNCVLPLNRKWTRQKLIEEIKKEGLAE